MGDFNQLQYGDRIITGESLSGVPALDNYRGRIHLQKR